MTSVVDICNRALIKIGADTITSLDEQTKEARLCNTLYDMIRKELLRSHPWNFAIKRLVLAADLTVPEFGYDWQYPLPTDCLRILHMYDSGYPFKVEGRFLLTDEVQVAAVYIANITDTEQFDALFVSLLVCRLAVEMGYSITGATFIAQGLKEELAQLRKDAKLFDAQEGSPDELPDGDWLGSRK